MSNTACEFLPSRSDGRSDVEIICELFDPAQRGDVIRYTAIEEALRQNTDRHFTRQSICRAVRRAETRLLKEFGKAFEALPNVGYRVALPEEHVRLSNRHSLRARQQVRKGLTIIANTPTDDMDPQALQLHRGQLMVSAGLANMMDEVMKRQAKIDSVVGDLHARLSKIEAKE